jgi:mediator of RNA polymerase II transcription subunit 13
LPSTARFDFSGFVHFNDNVLKILQKGLYEPAKVWKGPKSSTTPSSSQNNISSPASATDGSLRTAQAFNARSVATNATIAPNRENGATSTLVKHEIVAAEHDLSDRIIKERFISSVLATLSYRMCYESGCVPLNARTLVLSSPSYHQFSEIKAREVDDLVPDRKLLIITLDVHLTSYGTLITKAWPTRAVEFTCLGLSASHSYMRTVPPEGSIMVLGPSGRLGGYLGVVDDPEQRPTEFSRGLISTKGLLSQWKARCVNWLVKKGIDANMLEECDWLYVQIPAGSDPAPAGESNNEEMLRPLENTITVAWPAPLCFYRAHVEIREIANTGHGYDPLDFAERWCTEYKNLEQVMEKRKKERDAADQAAKIQAEAEKRALDPAHRSSAALRRASIAGAVYPTPPDGVQPIAGATPSFDGTVSTPGHLNPRGVPADTDGRGIMKEESEETSSNMWDDNNNNKREEPNTTMDFNDNVNEPLFDDMGADLFGETITDADFSFFDEPDTAMEDSAVDGPAGTGFNERKDDLTTIVEGEASTRDRTSMDPDTEVIRNGEEGNHPAEGGNATTVLLSDPPSDDVPGGSVQRTVDEQPSSPLSPEQIFRRLSIAGRGSIKIPPAPALVRRTSNFTGVQFDPSLASIDKKYGENGQFIYPTIPKVSTVNPLRGLPETGYLEGRRKKHKSAITNAISSAPGSVRGVLPGKQQYTGSRGDPGSSSGGSAISDLDDTSETSDDGPRVFTPSLKRKRISQDTSDSQEEDIDMTSPVEQSVSAEHDLALVSDFADLDLTTLDGDPADWSLAPYLGMSEPQDAPIAIRDADFIALAQVLAEQAISRTLKIPGLGQRHIEVHPKINAGEQSFDAITQQSLVSAVKSCFGQHTQCSVSHIPEIQDLQVASHINRPLPRPQHNPRTILFEAQKPGAIYEIPTPHITVRRAESKLVVLPSVVPFWENLGLAPCKGAKEVAAICTYPDDVGMKDSVDAFLDHIRSAYESSRLGTHERFNNTELADGHFPLDLRVGTSQSVADYQAVLSSIQKAAVKLSGILATGSATDVNIVIYHLYDANFPQLLVPICSAFHDLFQLYKDGLNQAKMSVQNELVLQLVPLSFVASPTSLVIPRPLEYAQLAFEVYDRCVDLKVGSIVPSIVLEPPLPKNIDFRCTPNPSQSPLQENSVMHVAYVQSLDERWISAAWTDNMGTKQATTSYCLGRRGSPLTTTFAEVANEIWETTLEIISYCKVQWRIMIAKCGVMEQSEIDFWRGLVSTDRGKDQLSLTIITVDSDPSLRILPPPLPSSSLQSLLAPQAPSQFATPVSTPQPSMASPEVFGSAGQTPARDGGGAAAPQPPSAPTPGNDTSGPGANIAGELKFDTDSTLVDITDQTWGMILSHRLNNSRSLLDFRPALASGYLLKRCTPIAASDTTFGDTSTAECASISSANSPLAALEVNIVGHEVPGKGYGVGGGGMGAASPSSTGPASASSSFASGSAQQDQPTVPIKPYEPLLREVLASYRGLATLARVRGVVDPQGRDTRPWHVAAAEKAVRALYLLM